MQKERIQVYLTRRIYPFLVGIGSASIMLLAFFIPSLQDQWDRYQSRKVIEQYVTVGNDLMKEEKYDMAQEAFAKAYELSENKRLDIEVQRLNAKIHLVYQDPDWDDTIPEDLEEVDFQFLLHLQKEPDQQKQRAETLTAYAIYLASSDRPDEAKDNFQQAIKLNPNDAITYINLGNLFDQQGDTLQARTAYQKATELNPKNFHAHYNLGLLLSEQGNLKEAEAELLKAKQLMPNDTDAIYQYNLIQQQTSKQ